MSDRKLIIRNMCIGFGIASVGLVLLCIFRHTSFIGFIGAILAIGGIFYANATHICPHCDQYLGKGIPHYCPHCGKEIK